MTTALKTIGIALWGRRCPKCSQSLTNTALKYSRPWKSILKILIQKKSKKRNKKLSTNISQNWKQNWNTITWNTMKFKWNRWVKKRRAVCSCKRAKGFYCRTLKSVKRKNNFLRPLKWRNLKLEVIKITRHPLIGVKWITDLATLLKMRSKI